MRRWLVGLLVLLATSHVCWAGTARDFDGVDDNVSFTTVDHTLLTLSAWAIYDTDGDSLFPRIVNQPAYTLSVDRSPTNCGATPGCLNFSSIRSTNGTWVGPTGSFLSGTRAHVFVSYDSTSTTNAPQFLLNCTAQEVTLFATPIGAQVSNAGTGYVGNRAAGDRSWDGRITSLELFSVLVPTALCNDLRFHPGILGADDQTVHLPLRGASSPEEDLSGNGRTGTVSGAVNSTATVGEIYLGGSVL